MLPGVSDKVNGTREAHFQPLPTFVWQQNPPEEQASAQLQGCLHDPLVHWLKHGCHVWGKKNSILPHLKKPEAVVAKRKDKHNTKVSYVCHFVLLPQSWFS